MGYQVIARKYRPQRFQDVVGQDHVTRTLSNAVEQNRIAHAYIFCGPRGTGKTTVARIFAKCLNCENGPKVDFDEADERCVEITEGRAIDVLEIDGASNNGVDQVRELRDTANYAPASSRYKIYIIDEVHMLTTQAFNALLKTLEEPPAHVKFLFATTDPEKVLPTILSRCQRFDLRRIPAALIVEHLAHIAEAEGVKADESALYAIARGADGGMRDAESTLDQLISFCGETITEPDVLSMFGLVSRDQVLRLAGAIVLGDQEGVVRELDDLARNGKDLGRLLGELLNHFRNLLIHKVSKGDARLLEVSEAELKALEEQSGQLEAGTVARIMEVFAEGEGRLRDAVSKKILVEVTFLKAIEAREAVSIDSVLKELADLRGELPAPASPAGAPQAETPPPSRPESPADRVEAGVLRETRPAPAAAAAAPASTGTDRETEEETRAELETGAEDVDALAEAAVAADGPRIDPNDLAGVWRELLDAIRRASRFTHTYLLKAFPVSLEKGELTIGFDPEFSDQLPLVDNPRNRTLLKTKLGELGLDQPAVRFVQIEAPAGAGAAQPEVCPTLPEADTEPERAARTRPKSTPAPAPARKPKAAPSAEAKEVESEKAEAKPRPRKLDPAEFQDDPLIKDALEVFRGRIVEVRGR